MKTSKIIDEIKLNEKLWDNAIKYGNKEDMQIYCDIVTNLKKSIYPVVISVVHSRDFAGIETGEHYLLADWSKITGWADSDIFHKIVKGRYEQNEVGILTGVRFERSGGSAYLEFNTEAKDIVIRELKKAGYMVELA